MIRSMLLLETSSLLADLRQLGGVGGNLSCRVGLSHTVVV